MRASRLLQMLLLLQNRGRLTAAQLANELEVSPRTILRDVDAMTEAGLPIIVFQGNQGGIELGFNYRTRLTGLDQAEAEALGVMLGTHNPALAAMDMDQAFKRARSKLVESFPDKVRDTAQHAMTSYRISFADPGEDPRIKALAQAVRSSKVVRIKANGPDARTIHPVALAFSPCGWTVSDRISNTEIPIRDCGDINISAHRFDQGVFGD